MQRQKTIAMMVALIMGSTATAYALNVGVINATRPKPAAASTLAAEPDVTTIVVNVPYDTGPTTSLEPEVPVTTEAIVAQSVAAPEPTPAPTPAPTAPPATLAPTAVAPVAATSAPASISAPASTTYETFSAGPAGDVVIARTGNTLEFWAAYTANGWNYRVETAKGQEVVVKYRLGEAEMKFIAKLEGGRIATLVEGPSGGGGGEDD